MKLNKSRNILPVTDLKYPNVQSKPLQNFPVIRRENDMQRRNRKPTWFSTPSINPPSPNTKLQLSSSTNHSHGYFTSVCTVPLTNHAPPPLPPGHTHPSFLPLSLLLTSNPFPTSPIADCPTPASLPRPTHLPPLLPPRHHVRVFAKVVPSLQWAAMDGSAGLGMRMCQDT